MKVWNLSVFQGDASHSYSDDDEGSSSNGSQQHKDSLTFSGMINLNIKHIKKAKDLHLHTTKIDSQFHNYKEQQVTHWIKHEITLQ